VTLTNVACSMFRTSIRGTSQSRHRRGTTRWIGSRSVWKSRRWKRAWNLAAAPGARIVRARSGGGQRHSAAAADEPMGERATLDVKGDGRTDDTAALRAAIEEHQTLFFPSGIYRVSARLN